MRQYGEVGSIKTGEVPVDLADISARSLQLRILRDQARHPRLPAEERPEVLAELVHAEEAADTVFERIKSFKGVTLPDHPVTFEVDHAHAMIEILFETKSRLEALIEGIHEEYRHVQERMRAEVRQAESALPERDRAFLGALTQFRGELTVFHDLDSNPMRARETQEEAIAVRLAHIRPALVHPSADPSAPGERSLLFYCNIEVLHEYRGHLQYIAHRIDQARADLYQQHRDVFDRVKQLRERSYDPRLARLNEQAKELKRALKRQDLLLSQLAKT